MRVELDDTEFDAVVTLGLLLNATELLVEFPPKLKPFIAVAERWAVEMEWPLGTPMLIANAVLAEIQARHQDAQVETGMLKSLIGHVFGIITAADPKSTIADLLATLEAQGVQLMRYNASNIR